MPSGGIEGQVVSRRGRGRSDRPLKNPRSSKISDYVVQNKLGNFSHSQNEENWIDFWVWETDFRSLRGHF